MEAFSKAVQLIIKAPNQNIDDQTVNCDLDWTVKKLKFHLSEVYPSKPKIQDQKLIYSGRLLHDHLHLKDILRHEDGQASIHTLHLVCNAQDFCSETPQDSEIDTSHNLLHNEAQLESELQEGAAPSSSVPSEQISTGLRHRSTQQSTTESQYGYQAFPQYIQMTPTMMPPFQMSPELMAHQIATMQQMYANYFAHYMQNIQIPEPTTESSTAADETSQVFPTGENEREHNQEFGVPPRPANGNVRMNAQGGPVLDDDDELGNRDWLDWFYVCCRAFVLFSIVYFYSSPGRFMVVTALAILAYLYQGGWFAARRPNFQQEDDPHQRPLERNANEEHHPHDDNLPADDENVPQSNQGMQNGHEVEAVMDGDEPLHVVQPQDDSEDRASTAWTFISSFFSSLIPEQPAPVNIN